MPTTTPLPLVVLALVGSCLGPVAAEACSCEPTEPSSPASLITSAAADSLVYYGTVVADRHDEEDWFRTYTIEVITTLGGDHSANQFIATGQDGASCGVELAIGATYLLRPNTTGSLVEETGAPMIGLCCVQWQVFTDPAFVSEVLATAVKAETWAQVKRRNGF
ncbi:MAG: hypothetical protein GKR89_26255 [Candidatus Latescibacteria bacterium]|nr:hypothetical protein [Candidatus Latescibacterota bacterium]